MVINVKAVRLSFILLISAVALNGHAQQFYKWVDEDGVTHYEEERPSQNIDHVSIELPDEYVESNPEEDYYSIQNQLKRLQDRREQQRIAKQEARAEKNQQEVKIQEVYVERYEPERRYYVPGYYPRYKNPHHYKPKHPQCCNKPVIEKPPAGITHKVNSNRSTSGLVASRYK